MVSFHALTSRWPPSYDADELAESIKALIETDTLTTQFYWDEPKTENISQGDIVSLKSNIPLIFSDGSPVVGEEFDYWMVIGNSCDFARDNNDVLWSQIVPILDLGKTSDLNQEQIRALRNYRTAKRFFIPPWKVELEEIAHVADFLRPITIHKDALRNIAQREAQLSYHSWILLNSCLVRFFARDDGRFD